MPTAAKLFAAVAFAVVGFFAAEVYKPGLPDGTQFGYFSLLVAALGVVCGWIIMGRAVGRGTASAMGSGLKVSIFMVLWSLLGFSIYEMILRSFKKRYDGPMEALLAVFDLMLDYGRAAATPEVLGVLIVGGLFGGWLSEFAARNWK